MAVADDYGHVGVFAFIGIDLRIHDIRRIAQRIGTAGDAVGVYEDAVPAGQTIHPRIQRVARWLEFAGFFLGDCLCASQCHACQRSYAKTTQQ